MEFEHSDVLKVTPQERFAPKGIKWPSARRAYSAAEYGKMLKKAGLIPGEVTPTLVHCGTLAGGSIHS